MNCTNCSCVYEVDNLYIVWLKMGCGYSFIGKLLCTSLHLVVKNNEKVGFEVDPFWHFASTFMFHHHIFYYFISFQWVSKESVFNKTFFWKGV